MFISNDELNGMNLLNFLNSQKHMIRSFENFTHHVFLGFLQEVTSSEFGILFDGRRFCALHSFYNNEQYANGFISDKLICEHCPYVLMFLGCDDTSYFKRFVDFRGVRNYLKQFEGNGGFCYLQDNDISFDFYFNS